MCREYIVRIRHSLYGKHSSVLVIQRLVFRNLANIGIVLKKEISPELQSLINCDQFAYKEGTMQCYECSHHVLS